MDRYCPCALAQVGIRSIVWHILRVVCSTHLVRSVAVKVLTLDIETSPNVAHVWGLFNQTVSLSQLRQSTEVICFAAKWYGQKPVIFHSDHHDGHDEMIQRAHDLVDSADAVIHYNGTKFDMPHLRREFLLTGLKPPSPVQEIDLLRTVRSQFRFTSNKLDHVLRQVGIEGKVAHSGHDLWVRCMTGDAKAWALMKKYNIGDVVKTEQLYDHLLPWIKNYPHVGLYTGEAHVCSNCGSADLRREGFSFTSLSKFQRFQCKGCGKWSRSAKAVDRVDERGVS